MSGSHLDPWPGILYHMVFQYPEMGFYAEGLMPLGWERYQFLLSLTLPWPSYLPICNTDIEIMVFQA